MKTLQELARELVESWTPATVRATMIEEITLVMQDALAAELDKIAAFIRSEDERLRRKEA